MANPTAGQFQTLVAAAQRASAALSFQNAMIGCIFHDYRPIATTPGQAVTLNINIPRVNEGDVKDIGSGPLQPADYAYDTVSLPFNHNDSTSFVIKSWDQIRSPADLEKLFLKPKLEGLLRAINRRLIAMINATTFNAYSTVSGVGVGKFARADISSAWQNLATAGIPVEDQGDTFLMTNATAYGNMAADTSFYQAFVVGEPAAVEAQRRSHLVDAFGAQIKWDQQLAANGSGFQPGLFFHRYAIAMVSAPTPSFDDPSIHETTIYPIPGVKLGIRIQMQASLKDQGTVVNLLCAHGEAVVRNNFGSYMLTA
jgi:hypothetical protein